jgi:alanyl-tRNA synthetase
MGPVYPELIERAGAVDMWLSAEEEGFGRTLAQGMEILQADIAAARSEGHGGVPAAQVFRLHDTYGFPHEMTRELLAEAGLAIEGEFEDLMEAQRSRSRSGRALAGAAAAAGENGAADASGAAYFAGRSAFHARFTGYETETQRTSVGDAEPVGEATWLLKLAESPFYAAGGGQVQDQGTLACEDGDCHARVLSVFRVGDDQVIAAEFDSGEPRVGEPILARVDHLARHATEANHTATHLLQAALRERLGSHVHQAGSYVGPDKLRFDFSHGHGLSAGELRDVEDRVNEWISRNDPVRPITTTLEEAKSLGAMALFGEKYGEIVRMVEVGEGEYSRELCGGTHVRSTAEIGIFRILHETSSSANVRRIEAVTGPEAARLLRAHDRLLGEVSGELRNRPEDAPEAVRKLLQERRRLERAIKEGGGEGAAQVDVGSLLSRAEEISGAPVLAASVEVDDAKALLDLVDRLKGQLDGAAILLGTAVQGRVHLIAGVSPALVERGVRAGAVVKAAAEVVGGGGGGRDTLAQAGGRDPEKLGEAVAAGRAVIEAALAG